MSFDVDVNAINTAQNLRAQRGNFMSRRRELILEADALMLEQGDTSDLEREADEMYQEMINCDRQILEVLKVPVYE